MVTKALLTGAGKRLQQNDALPKEQSRLVIGQENGEFSFDWSKLGKGAVIIKVEHSRIIVVILYVLIGKMSPYFLDELDEILFNLCENYSYFILQVFF